MTQPIPYTETYVEIPESAQFNPFKCNHVQCQRLKSCQYVATCNHTQCQRFGSCQFVTSCGHSQCRGFPTCQLISTPPCGHIECAGYPVCRYLPSCGHVECIGMEVCKLISKSPCGHAQCQTVGSCQLKPKCGHPQCQSFKSCQLVATTVSTPTGSVTSVTSMTSVKKLCTHAKCGQTCSMPCGHQQCYGTTCKFAKGGANAWAWVGGLILWLIIFTVMFWLIYYSLAPSFFIKKDTNQVDTAKVLLASVISALILIIIAWAIVAVVRASGSYNTKKVTVVNVGQ